MPRQVRALRPGARSVYPGGYSFRGILCTVECDRAPGCDSRGHWLAGPHRSIPSDPVNRGPLHPLRLRCPPSPYRGGYASVERLAERGTSSLSMHGLFRNGSLDAGGCPKAPLATLRPPAAGSTRRNICLTPSAAPWNHSLPPGSSGSIVMIPQGCGDHAVGADR
jgi:hypothetical protein